MYQSPIDLIVSEINTKLCEQQEKTILEAVRNVGVNVDKDELIKALRYDREQYNAGYADGYEIGLREGRNAILEILKGLVNDD